ncbi:MAG: hypothetical protein GY796_24365 [Chloroflexi bacterium]|nr:hypothetical protein [Chloroflexota bacterium]
MEEEIDLRPYIEAILKRWYWVVGAGVLAAVAAFIVVSLQTPTYEAISLVAVVGASNIVQFDQRIRETEQVEPLKAFPDLALSDQVLNNLLTEQPFEEPIIIDELRDRLTAESGSDASIIQLTAVSPDPAEAAALANNWAAIFVNWANDIYGDTSGEQARFYEKQLETAQEDLQQAEEALIAFQAVNQQLLLQNRLDSYSQTQANLLATQQTMGRLTQDAQALRNQLAALTGDGPITTADQLSALFLQMKTFNPVQVDAETAVPIQFQLDTSRPLTTDDREEQIAQLDGLLETLEEQGTQIDTELTELSPLILEVQEDVQTADTEHNRLLREQKVIEETVTVLARKVEEEKITTADTTQGVRLASEAAVPRNPANQNRSLLLIVAFLSGTILSAFFIFTLEWWHRELGESRDE